MDPYLILGIESNATQEEIKQAYRRLAMKWHPDRNQDSGDAKERFHQAAEAYKILFEKAPKEKYGRAETNWSDDSQANGDPQSARHRTVRMMASAAGSPKSVQPATMPSPAAPPSNWITPRRVN